MNIFTRYFSSYGTAMESLDTLPLRYTLYVFSGKDPCCLSPEATSGQRHCLAILVTVTLYAASAFLKRNCFYVSLSERRRKHDREMAVCSSI